MYDKLIKKNTLIDNKVLVAFYKRQNCLLSRPTRLQISGDMIFVSFYFEKGSHINDFEIGQQFDIYIGHLTGDERLDVSTMFRSTLQNRRILYNLDNSQSRPLQIRLTLNSKVEVSV